MQPLLNLDCFLWYDYPPSSKFGYLANVKNRVLFTGAQKNKVFKFRTFNAIFEHFCFHGRARRQSSATKQIATWYNFHEPKLKSVRDAKF